jgi:hypothetical protein
VAGRSGQREPARSPVGVQLSLDRVQHDRGLLVLVDEDRVRAGDEDTRISRDGIPGRRFVEIEDLGVRSRRQRNPAHLFDSQPVALSLAHSSPGRCSASSTAAVIGACLTVPTAT